VSLVEMVAAEFSATLFSHLWDNQRRSLEDVVQQNKLLFLLTHITEM
jgi:hypothetical protein